jgi:hypothetical protein
MKTVKLLMLTLMMSVLMIGETSAMIKLYAFANYAITTNEKDCVPGQGICLIVATAKDQMAGELKISSKTLGGFFTVSPKTEGFSSYLKNGMFVLADDSYLNPAVLEAETGIKGLYKIAKGTYKAELTSTGFYKVYISLSK